jgi:hypothetical protein
VCNIGYAIKLQLSRKIDENSNQHFFNSSNFSEKPESGVQVCAKGMEKSEGKAVKNFKKFR